MAYDSFTLAHLYAVRWQRFVLDEMQEVLAAAKALRRRVGRELIYVSIRDDESELPDAALRQHSTTMAVELLDHCSDMFILLAMHGFQASMARSVITGMKATGRTLAPQKAHKVHIVDSIEPVLELTAELCPPQELLARLRDAGVWRRPD